MTTKTVYSVKQARDVPIDRITISKLEKILANSIPVGDCYIHQNSHHSGYSYTRLFTNKYGTHRIIKAVADGKNYPSLVTDHLCRNRACIRLSHLELVTSDENVKRGVSAEIFINTVIAKKKAQTHCKNGHELNEANTHTTLRSDIRPGTIRRSCRVCHKINERRRRHAQKES